METLKHFLLLQALGLVLGLILNLIYIACGLGCFYMTYAVFAVLFAAIWVVYELAQWYVRIMIKDFENSQLIKNNEKVN